MLTKPLAHLRPLLRLPSHTHTTHTQPDHFTPNPSLPHHLPRQGGRGGNAAGRSHALATPGAAHTTGHGAGGAKGAGQGRGYGRESGAGSGYTGHARAFLALPQGSHVDPNAGLATDDSREEHALPSALTRQPYRSSPQRSVPASQSSLADSSLNDVRYRQSPTDIDLSAIEEEKRFGGVSELASGWSRAKEAGDVQVQAVEAGDIDARSHPSRRRSSVSVAQLSSASRATTPASGAGSPRLLAPSPLPAFLPGHGPALSRTTSFMDIGLLGMPGRPGVARAMSSATISRADSPLPLATEIEQTVTPIPTLQSASSARLVPQANRILMDLAGRDVPAVKSIGRRYNSTSATAHRTQHSWSDDIAITASTRSLSSEEAQNQDKDRKIYAAIRGAIDYNQTSLFHGLVRHYRSARKLAPFDEREAIGVPEFAKKYPLPSSWTVNTYNLILQGLNHLRVDGESVAPALEIYNEMLERDVLPNGRTYAAVIQALSMRERDVWTAVERWEAEKTWLTYREQVLGVPAIEEMAIDKGNLIKGYIAEGNMISALRLFRAAVTFHNTSGWRFAPETYYAVLGALAKQRSPDYAAVDHVWRHAYNRSVGGWRALSRYVFAAYGKRDDKEHLEKAYADFDGYVSGMVEQDKFKMGDWTTRYVSGESDEAAYLAMAKGQIREAFEAAIEAFVQQGDVDKATKIFERAAAFDFIRPNSNAGEAKPSSELYAAYLASLARHGHVAKAKEEFTRLEQSIKQSLLGRLPITCILELVDHLVPAGEWRFALDLLRMGDEAEVLHDPEYVGATAPKSWLRTRAAQARLRKVYIGLLADGAKASFAEEARAILDLSSYPELTSSGMNVSPPVTRAAIELLTKHALWDLGVSHAMLVDEVEEHSAVAEVLMVFAARAVDSLPIGAGTDVYLSLIRRSKTGLLRMPVRADRFLRRYAEDRAVLSDAHGGQQPPAEALLQLMPLRGWSNMVNVLSLRFALLEGANFNEGEYDTALELLVGDFETLRLAGSPADRARVLSAPKMADVVLTLRERFGPERMHDMALRAFGERADDYLDRANVEWRREAFRDFEIPSAVQHPQTGSAEAESVDSVSQIGLSSEDGQADSATSFAPSTSPNSPPAPPAPTHKVDPALTRELDGLLKQMIGNSQRQSALVSQAYRLIAAAFEQGRVPNTTIIARVIAQTRRVGDEGAIRHMYDMAQVAIASFVGNPGARAVAWRTVEDAMIVACCHLGRLEQAGAHRARIIESGMTPSADAYATMIASSKDTTDDALVAREMFDESQRLGVKPHLYLYNTIISKLSKARKVELALELFAHMKAAGVQPSSVTYGAVMNACTRVGDAQSAENLFEEMRMQPNFKPRVPPYNTMMQLFVQTTPNREKALHYYGLLRAAGVPPSAHTYKLLLDLHATLAPFDLAAAERVFSDIESDPSVAVQGSHFASLITGYGIYADDMPKALEVFERIYTRQDAATILQEAVVWEAVLNVVAHRGDLPQLETMRRRMEESGGGNVRPTAYVYNVLITGYARGGAIQTARDLFESMGDSITGVAAPNNHPVLHTSSGLPKPSTRTPAMGRADGDGVEQTVFREPSTYEAMLRAELSVGDLPKAQAVMVRMEQRGYPWAVVARVQAVLDEATMAQIAQTSQPLADTPSTA